MADSNKVEPFPTAARFHKKGPWTAAEDALLVQLVQNQHGSATRKGSGRPTSIDWTGIASHFEGRRPKDCRKRWNGSLCPGISRGSWAPSEDKLLQQGMQIYPSQWAKIAMFVGSRTGDQCSSRWRVLCSGADWNDERDNILLNFVNNHGKRWAELRRVWLPMFTNAECRNRYHRIIRRLSADKRHETELETLKSACTRHAASAALVDGNNTSPVVHNLADIDKSNANRSSFCSTTSSSSSSSNSSSNEQDTQASTLSPGPPPHQSVQQASTQRMADQALGLRGRERQLTDIVKKMMVDNVAREKLMQLAETIVSVAHCGDQQCGERMEPDDILTAWMLDPAIHSDAGSLPSLPDNAGVEVQDWTSVPSFSDTEMLPVDNHSVGSPERGLPLFQPYAPALGTLPMAIPSTGGGAASRAAGTQTSCRQCELTPCVCNWMDELLPQGWLEAGAGAGASAPAPTATLLDDMHPPWNQIQNTTTVSGVSPACSQSFSWLT